MKKEFPCPLCGGRVTQSTCGACKSKRMYFYLSVVAQELIRVYAEKRGLSLSQAANEAFLQLENYGENMQITVGNNGKYIKETDFFESEHAQKGFYFCSLNAGAWRLLVPKQQEYMLKEIKTAKRVEIERTTLKGRKAFQIWFEDGTDSPFQVTVLAEMVVMNPDKTWGDKPFPFLVYTKAGLQKELTAKLLK